MNVRSAQQRTPLTVLCLCCVAVVQCLQGCPDWAGQCGESGHAAAGGTQAQGRHQIRCLRQRLKDPADLGLSQPRGLQRAQQHDLPFDTASGYVGRHSSATAHPLWLFLPFRVPTSASSSLA